MNVVFKLPQMSMTMVDGVIASWKKGVGDTVEANEVLLEVETDKMVKELTAPVSGYITKINAEEGDIVDVGGALCTISDQMDDSQESSAPDEAASPVIEKEVPADSNQGTNINCAKQPTKKQRISPLAKKIAIEKGVDTDQIIGTGPGGTIVKKDVLNAESKSFINKLVTATATNHQNTATFAEKIIPLRGIRKTIANNMMLSRQNTAFLTTFAEVNLTRLAECRKFVKQSYTTYVVAACAKALQEEKFEMIRSKLVGDNIHISGEININVSVATGHSLVTPVIRNADLKNVITIGDEIKSISEQARGQGLSADALESGCFTVTNSGVFGSLFYTPIINYPQSAIMGMGKIMKTPVVVDDEIVIAPMMYLCLSYDHQLIDGETGAPFLQKVKYYLEHPEELFQPAQK